MYTSWLSEGDQDGIVSSERLSTRAFFVLWADKLTVYFVQNGYVYVGGRLIFFVRFPLGSGLILELN